MEGLEPEIIVVLKQIKNSVNAVGVWALFILMLLFLRWILGSK